MGCVVLNGALGERRLAAHCELSNREWVRVEVAAG